jgi:hypothetical protein
MEADGGQLRALVRRAQRHEIKEFLAQGEACGWCARPIRLRGYRAAIDAAGKRTVVFSTLGQPDGVVLKACGNRRETRCPSCAALYRSDARHLVKAGLEGGKGVDASVTAHPAVLLTLTAPSFGIVHSAKAGRAPCHPGSPTARCGHGRSLSCFVRHDGADELVGTPLCPQCYRYDDQVLFNATVPELWRRTSVYLPRMLAKVLGITQVTCAEYYRISFARVAELQRRGAVHLHVVLRLDATDVAAPSVEPEQLALAARLAARAVFVHHGALSSRFGDQVRADVLDRLRDGTRAGRIGSYVSKYATKASTTSGALDGRICSEADLCSRRLSAHERRLVGSAWELGGTEHYSRLRLRRYAHCFAYGGLFLTKSRCYSTTFGALRRARAEFRDRERHHPADESAVAYESSFRAIGAGWATKDEARHAELSRLAPRAGPWSAEEDSP